MIYILRAIFKMYKLCNRFFNCLTRFIFDDDLGMQLQLDLILVDKQKGRSWWMSDESSIMCSMLLEGISSL